MIRNSLTAKIIISVGIVISVVIGVCAYIIVIVQTNELMDRAKRNGIYINHLVNQYVSQFMLTGNRKEIKEFFININKSEEVRKIFLFDENGRIVFSSNQNDIGMDADDFHRGLFENIEGRVKYKVQEKSGIFSIVTPISNKPECQQCHDTARATLGALALDISLVPAEKEIVKNRNLIILFALVGLVLVSAVLSVLVVIMVKRPINKLIGTMTEVEQGNFDVKVDIKNKDELGQLGNSFNSMIARLERTNMELLRHHEMQLQQAEKMATIGELASGIAHEIKNPLAGIGAAIQVLADEFDLRNTHSEVVDEIMLQLDRLNKNTRDLLSFARPAEPRFLSGDLNEVVSKAVFFVRKQAEKQKIGIKEELEKQIPKIFLDPEQMQQVFLNIMLNAVQATPEGGNLTISTQKKPEIVPVIIGAPGVRGSKDNVSRERIEISFSDTGKGITEEHLKKIFNPFFSTKHRGTGLGLAISRNIVEKHGGHIEVKSKPGRGTNVTVVLPVNGSM